MSQSDYTSLGYDEWLRRDFSFVADNTEDEAQIKTPQVSASTIKGDIPKETVQKAIEDLIQFSAPQFGTSLQISLTNGQQATLRTTLVDKVNSSRRMFGVVEITTYEDTLGLAAKRIPEGAVADLSKYSIYSGYDYHNNEIDSDGNVQSWAKKGLTFMYTILNTSGSTHTIHFLFRWRFMGTQSDLGT